MYGLTKLQQEQLCRQMSETIGAELVILRYFNVIGSRQSLTNPYTGILTAFYRAIINATPIQLYELGRPVRDFVHVSDVVAANVRALDVALEAPCMVLNVGSGVASTIRDLAVALSRATASAAVAIEDTAQFRLGDIYGCIADIRRTESVLGWSPTRDLDSSVEQFVAWAKTQVIANQPELAASELARRGLLDRASGSS
jgi:dTDP-L-rhamnose 4-epimerase